MEDPPRRSADRAARLACHPTERHDEQNACPATLSARELLGPAQRIIIEHDGSHYELRLTRNNKLILTK